MHCILVRLSGWLTEDAYPSSMAALDPLAEAAMETPMETPMEHELRYMRPADFVIPETLGPLVRSERHDNHHIDRYFDAVSTSCEPILWSQGCSLRARVKNDGRLIATFKREVTELPTDYASGQTVREEWEDVLSNDAQQAHDRTFIGYVRHLHCPTLDQAQQLIGDQPLVFLFSIENARTDTHYQDERSAVILSEDQLTYPDGSTEQRLEIELISGDREILATIAAALAEQYPELAPVERGKLAEGRRRLARLLI